MAIHVVVTPGDPRGIGPEVVTRALGELSEDGPPVTIVGPEGPLAMDELTDIAEQWRGRDTRGADAEAGAFAAVAIERAVETALAGDAQAVVTAPLHKPSLRAAGRHVPGQTEMLGKLTGSDEVGMLMAAEQTRLDAPLRVLLATTHLALRDVPTAVSSELLTRQTRLLYEALRLDWGIEAPRIGVCALNPHASDGGLFGDEEERIFAPAITALRGEGLDVAGPLPADTVFARALGGELDAVVAPYHDVGMAAFKTVSFGAGVNVTLGLPFIRTSPDHGTAFDIAGMGKADASSMAEALRLARQLAKRRFDTLSTDV